MTRPVVSAATEALYSDVAPNHPYDESLGWPFLIFISGFVQPFATLYDLVRDTTDGSGWSPLVDPDRCPPEMLFWLAQLVGVRLQGGASVADQRAQITSPAPLRRGTPSAMRDAARRTLTGSRSVAIHEHDGTPYRLTVVTVGSETPYPAVTEAALRSQKPAGLVLTYISTDQNIWDVQADTWDDQEATWDGAGDLYPGDDVFPDDDLFPGEED